MRKIKFRGRCATESVWRYGYYRKHGSLHLISDKNGIEFAVLAVTVGEYTGLKDKNGVEVYEDSLIRARVRVYAGSKEVVMVRRVIMLNGCWCAVENKSNVIDHGFLDIRDFKLFDKILEGFEIIGNIHENPELLEANHE